MTAGQCARCVVSNGSQETGAQATRDRIAWAAHLAFFLMCQAHAIRPLAADTEQLLCVLFDAQTKLSWCSAQHNGHTLLAATQYYGEPGHDLVTGRRPMRPLGAYRELPLCVIPAHTERQAQSGQDAGGGGGGGSDGESSGYAVNTDLGFLSVPVSATAAEVHRHVEVGHVPMDCCTNVISTPRIACMLLVVSY